MSRLDMISNYSLPECMHQQLCCWIQTFRVPRTTYFVCLEDTSTFPAISVTLYMILPHFLLYYALNISNSYSNYGTLSCFLQFLGFFKKSLMWFLSLVGMGFFLFRICVCGCKGNKGKICSNCNQSRMLHCFYNFLLQTYFGSITRVGYTQIIEGKHYLLVLKAWIVVLFSWLVLIH